jgi:GT2 family glycosyltransferase
MVSDFPSITVTIAQWGKVDFTTRCVDALLRSDYPGELEIRVSDNDSPGGPGEVEGRPEVTLIRGDSNIGFGPAHNLLARRGRGDLLLILNNDTVVTPSALSWLVAAAEDEGVGAVTPRYLGFDGSNLEMGGYVGKDGWGWQLFRGIEPPLSLTRMPFPADYGSGACLLTRRDLFVESGGFDDAFAPAYYEDTDYCFRLWDRGLRVIVEPRAVVYHYEGATAGRSTSEGMKVLQLSHRGVFAERWSSRLAGRDPVSTASAMRRALDLGGHSVLWISPELPRPDHEAGHARMLAMLQSLRSEGSRVVLWAEMASAWERYGRILEEADIPWFAYRTSGRLGGTNPAIFSTLQELLGLEVWDLVGISFPEMAERFVPEIRGLAPRVPIVVDAVDLHFLRMSRDPDTDGADVSEWRERELAVYRSVDGVITAGDHELEVLADLLPEIPARTFASVATLDAAETPVASAEGELVFLGNANHQPNLAAVDEWVERIHPRLPEAVRAPLTLYGDGTERLAQRWPSDAVEVRGWASDLGGVFRRARLFVAPLTYGAGTKGKILEAAASGVPVITTSIGAEGYGGRLGEALVVADEPEEFAAAVARLLADDAAWEEACRRILDGVRAWGREEAVARSEWAMWMQRRRRLRRK